MPPGMGDLMAQMMGGGMGGMGGGMAPPGMGRQRPAAEQPDVIPNGVTAVVRGLTGAAQHNGKSGRVSGFDVGSRRYTVMLEDGEALSIKGDNLLQALSCEVTGMQSKPELNRQRGVVRDFDAAKGRYVLALGAQAVSLKPENLILPKGARAKVVGLVSQPQWNGKVGKVLEFDREKRRYVVQMTADQQLSLKLECLLL